MLQILKLMLKLGIADFSFKTMHALRSP